MATTRNALTEKEIIKRDGYDKLLKRAGWEATEAQIRADHHSKVAQRILAALPRPAVKSEGEPQSQVKTLSPKAALRSEAKAKPTALPAPLEGRYIEYQVAKSKTTMEIERGIVLYESGKPGTRIFEVLRLDGDVPIVKEADVVRVGKHFAEMAKDALA